MPAPGSLSRRRLIGLGAATAAGVGVLPACSSDSASPDGKVTIRFSYLWSGPEAKALEGVIDSFNASQSDIFVEGVSNPDAQAQLAAMTGSKGAFDVSDNYGNATGAWASKGIIRSLDEYIARDKFDVDALVQTATDQCRYEGQLYQLPLTVNNWAMLYNKTLFADVGIKEPPKTASDWAAACDELTKVSGGNVKQLGFAGPNGAPPNLRLLGVAQGGRWYDDNAVPTPDDPANIDGANLYIDTVVKKYGVKQLDRFASGFGEYQSPQNPFYQGKLAMVIEGEWQPAFIAEFAPDLDWGVASIPHPDDKPELANTTLVETGTLFIPSNSEHPDEAWEFIKYLMSAEAMLTFTRAISNLPSLTSLLTDESYSKLDNFDFFLDLLTSENATSIPSYANLAEYTSDLSTADDAINRLEKTPAQAYAEVAEAAQSYA